MKDYHLRGGTQSDRAWLYALYCKTMRSCIEATWGWDEEFQVAGFSNNLMPESWKIISNNFGDIGGFVLNEKDDHLWLEMIIVEPDYQKNGVGQRTMVFIQNLAAKKFLPLRLSVIKANPVKPFYVNLGFIQYSEDESFYKLEWRS